MNCTLNPSLDLAGQLLELLRQAPEGCSEYLLIQQLKARHSTHIKRLPLTDPLMLFRTHFLIFNALYRLRDRLWQEQNAHLQIGPLNVQLLPYQAGSAALSQHDSLREYYLDLRHLEETDEPEVTRLLSSFWDRLQAGEDQRAALELFELDDSSQPLALATVKYRYRQLVSQHHPDRGGSHERLQSINLAMEILERYYR